MDEKSTIFIFLDDGLKPVATFSSPANFELDTRKLVDGIHHLRIVSKDPHGKEGLRNISFEVRNGPANEVEGIKDNAVVDGVLPLMINAYGKKKKKKFLIAGSESPQSIPAWVWMLIIGFAGWALYYSITYMSLKS